MGALFEGAKLDRSLQLDEDDDDSVGRLNLRWALFLCCLRMLLLTARGRRRMRTFPMSQNWISSAMVGRLLRRDTGACRGVILLRYLLFRFDGMVCVVAILSCLKGGQMMTPTTTVLGLRELFVLRTVRILASSMRAYRSGVWYSALI